MRFATPIDRLLQTGGDWVTMLFWLLAVVGGISFVLGLAPESVSLGMSTTGITIYWMRFKNITVADMLARIASTRARHGDPDD